MKEEIINPYKNNKLEEINRIEHGIVIDTLTSVDSAEINKYSGFILEVFESCFCHNLEYKLYTEFVNDLFENVGLFISQRKDLLQNLARKIE